MPTHTPTSDSPPPPFFVSCTRLPEGLSIAVGCGYSLEEAVIARDLYLSEMQAKGWRVRYSPGAVHLVRRTGLLVFMRLRVEIRMNAVGLNAAQLN